MPFDDLNDYNGVNDHNDFGYMNVGDFTKFCDIPLLTNEDYTLSPYGSDFSLTDATYLGIQQTARTCGTLIQSTEPVTLKALAKSRDVVAAIDEVIVKATADDGFTPGEAKWTIDNYGRAYTYGVCHLT